MIKTNKIKTNKIISFWIAVLIICVATFPIYTLLAIDEVYSNVYYDAIFGNVLFALILVFGGRFTLLFGGLVAFQRILEILTVQIWGGGVFSTGITRQAFLHFSESSPIEIWGYIQLLYPDILLGTVIVFVYLIIYYLACKTVLCTLHRRRINHSFMRRVVMLGLSIWLVFTAWNNRVRTDVFFFENNHDQELKWLISKNTHPYLSTPVTADKKIDFYFILGESASSDHLNLYGYGRNTTPYLNSLSSDDLTVFDKAISPASSTFKSYELMFSRNKKSDLKMFFLSPNLIEELKHMGYRTLWQSYHPARRSFVYESLISSSDIFLSSDDNSDDRKMLPMVKDNLQDAPTVYIINMYGSHPYYDVPVDQKVFSKVSNTDRKQDVINRYDDTILALDSFIKDTVALAKSHSQKTGREYVVLYLSDHGQVLFKDGSDWAGHSTNANDLTGYRIPLLIINKKALPCSDSIKNVSGLNTGDTFYMVMSGLCGIRTQ